MSQRILNVGCGDSTYGTDFIDLYPSRIEVKKCDINKDKFPYKDGTFDKVFAEFVIAHLTNQSNLISESKRVLKKGGQIDLLTNNAGFWGIFGKTFYGNYEKMNRQKGHMHDKQYALFTPISLKNLLETYGFRQIRYEYLLTTPGREHKTPIHHRILIALLVTISPRFSPHIRITARK